MSLHLRDGARDKKHKTGARPMKPEARGDVCCMCCLLSSHVRKVVVYKGRGNSRVLVPDSFFFWLVFQGRKSSHWCLFSKDALISL